jgi:hypothetical protein
LGNSPTFADPDLVILKTGVPPAAAATGETDNMGYSFGILIVNIRNIQSAIPMRAKLIAALVFSSSLALLASNAQQPRANLLELHSCEVYAGGCVVSSEATLGGRYMLRAWNFTGGSFAGSDFAGLRLAVLQSAQENLAANSAETGDAVVYLPEGISAAQRDALLAWLKQQPNFRPSKLLTRSVALRFGTTSEGYALTAGDFVSVKTADLAKCEAQACGEALWYTPRTPGTVFTVALNRASQIEEPFLKLKWYDAGKRSVFLARVGNPEVNKALYVAAADLCGPADKLF